MKKSIWYTLFERHYLNKNSNDIEDKTKKTSSNKKNGEEKKVVKTSKDKMN